MLCHVVSCPVTIWVRVIIIVVVIVNIAVIMSSSSLLLTSSSSLTSSSVVVSSSSSLSLTSSSSCHYHHHCHRCCQPSGCVTSVGDTEQIEGMSGSCHDTHPEHFPHDFDILESRCWSRIMTGIEPVGDHQIAEPQRHMIVVFVTPPVHVDQIDTVLVVMAVSPSSWSRSR